MQPHCLASQVEKAPLKATHHTFMAKISPVSRLRTWNTLPKAPWPTMRSSSKSLGPRRRRGLAACISVPGGRVERTGVGGKVNGEAGSSKSLGPGGAAGWLHASLYRGQLLGSAWRGSEVPGDAAVQHALSRSGCMQRSRRAGREPGGHPPSSALPSPLSPALASVSTYATTSVLAAMAACSSAAFMLEGGSSVWARRPAAAGDGASGDARAGDGIGEGPTNCGTQAGGGQGGICEALQAGGCR